MFPDLEIPFIVLFYGTEVPHRMVLHSILGSITLGTALALIVTVKLYPPLVSRLFRVDKQRVESKCRFSSGLVFSVLVGNLSHVLLDVTNHPYNPLFWPFRSVLETPSPIYFALGEPLGYLLMQIVMVALILVLIVVKRRNLFEELLVG
jgi:membrane-bound metal-dependent hydrolase YbcI (DUF457 family)